MNGMLSIGAVGWRWKKAILLWSFLGVLTACRATQDVTTAPHKSVSLENIGCYGFLNDKKIVLHCPDKVVMTSDLGIDGFVVSLTGKWLALVRSKIVVVDENRENILNRSEVVNLEKGVAVPSEFYPDDLVASCGTLVAAKPGVKQTIFDFVTGKQFSKDPYIRFQCSEDQKKIVGYASEYRDDSGLIRVELRSGYSPHQVISRSASGSFALSQNGNYIAFLATGSKICVQELEKQIPDCIDDPGSNIVAPFSVSNAGDLLFAHETGKACGNAECVGISVWHAGLMTPKMLEPEGKMPQWILEPNALEFWMNKHGERNRRP